MKSNTSPRLRPLSPIAALLGLSMLLFVGCSKKESEEKLVAPATIASASTAMPMEAKPSPEACRKCETSGPCAELSKGCSTLSGDDRAACDAVDQCIETTGCAKGEKSFTSCFCGTDITTDACLAAPVKGKGMPQGPCADVMRKTIAAGAASNHDILVSFQRPETVLGAAITRRNCQKGTECRVVCGY